MTNWDEVLGGILHLNLFEGMSKSEMEIGEDDLIPTQCARGKTRTRAADFLLII